MDEKDKKIKELQDQLTAAQGEVTQLKTDNTKLGEDIKAKDAIIEQKTKDIIGARKTYKKLSEMTEEEKEALSEKELELQKRQEELEASQAEFAKQQAELHAKEVTARRDMAIKKLVGEDPELVKKVTDNFGRIKDSDKAMTEEEISKVVGDAFNLLGDAKPNPISAAVNNDGGDHGGTKPGSFADTAQGKDFASKLGLPAEPAPAKTDATPLAPAA